MSTERYTIPSNINIISTLQWHAHIHTYVQYIQQSRQVTRGHGRVNGWVFFLDITSFFKYTRVCRIEQSRVEQNRVGQGRAGQNRYLMIYRLPPPPPPSLPMSENLAIIRFLAFIITLDGELILSMYIIILYPPPPPAIDLVNPQFRRRAMQSMYCTVYTYSPSIYDRCSTYLQYIYVRSNQVYTSTSRRNRVESSNNITQFLRGDLQRDRQCRRAGQGRQTGLGKRETKGMRKRNMYNIYTISFFFFFFFFVWWKNKIKLKLQSKYTNFFYLQQ